MVSLSRRQISIFASGFTGLCLLLIPLLAWPADAPPTPNSPTIRYQEQARWAEIGGDYQRFDQPCDVAVDHRGHIYVADCTLRAVFKFDQSGHVLKVWTGSPEVRFGNPASIAIDVSDLYIVDRYESRVFRFDIDGEFKDLWQLSGSDSGELSEALGICNDPLGAIYIADHNRDRINRYDSAGHYVSHFGDSAEGKAKLFGPTDLICDAEGNILTISFNDRIVKFSADGNVIGVWGQTGQEPGQFDDARGLAIDSQGNIYVADTENGRVQRLEKDLFVQNPTPQAKAKAGAPENSLSSGVTVWGQDASTGTVLKKPTGIAVLPNGIVIVSDTQDGSITFWKPIILDNPQPSTPSPPST